jgi:hypothetical protein
MLYMSEHQSRLGSHRCRSIHATTSNCCSHIILRVLMYMRIKLLQICHSTQRPPVRLEHAVATSASCPTTSWMLSSMPIQPATKRCRTNTTESTIPSTRQRAPIAAVAFTALPLLRKSRFSNPLSFPYIVSTNHNQYLGRLQRSRSSIHRSDRPQTDLHRQRPNRRQWQSRTMLFSTSKLQLRRLWLHCLWQQRF